MEGAARRALFPLLGVLVLLTIAWPAAAQSADAVGSPCRTRVGHAGQCDYPWRCSTRLWDEATGETPTPCSSTAVCCPFRTAATMVTPDTTQTGNAQHMADSQTEAGYKSQQKCEEWGRAVFRLEDSPDPGAPKVNRSLCGGEGAPYIIRGVPAEPMEFPHMAALGFGPEDHVQYLCGGTLISESWVLTAAHCLEDFSYTHQGPVLYVRLGDLTPEAEGSHPTAQDFHVLRRVPHPNYHYPVKENDVGLVQLDRRAVFNQYVRPACLYTQAQPAYETATVSGWGKTETASYSERLLKVELPLTDQSQCESVFRQLLQLSPQYKSVLPNGVVDSMMCAGEPAGGKDSCRGDSGGPLQVRNVRPYCTYSVLGVVSFGKGCAEPGYPGIFSRVSSFVPWIESVVWP